MNTLTNKRTLLTVLTSVVFLIGLLVGIMPAAAQQATPEPLICDRFEGQSDDVRVGYYMGEGAGYFTAGRYDDAIDSYSCVLQIDSNYAPAYVNRALSHTERRDYEAAIDDYDAAIDIREEAGLYNNRAIVYAALGDYDQALENITTALSLDPNNAVYLSNRGIIRAIRGEWSEAISDLERARDTDESNPQPFALLGIVYSEIALINYRLYLERAGERSDNRIQAAASSLESRLTFELRLDDGTWLLQAAFTE